MGRFVNPDNSAFQVALNSKIYVDKTGLIAYTNSVLDTMDGYICNSRPRRFGKSYAANMLTAYYSKGCSSEDMFSGLEISRDPSFRTHLNRYDVIHIDVQWFLANCRDISEVVIMITNSVLDELRELYPDVLNKGDVQTLPDALSRVKEKTGQKFVVIIDEWDVLIRDEDADEPVQEEYINFLRGMFKGTEPTKYIQLAYLTGILPIKKEKTQSAVNNLDEFTMLQADELAPYIGFTDNEVKELCEKYSRDFYKVKKWYDGYVLNGYHVYNPKAVVSVMTKGRYRSYWSETGSYEAVLPLIGMDYSGLKNTIIEMLSGVDVEVNTSTFKNDPAKINGRDDVLTYLIHLGYLAYDEENGKAFVPNEEIRQELSIAAASSNWDDMLSFQRESERLVDATIQCDENEVAAAVEKIHMEYASIIKYNDENALSSTLAIAYLGAMKYYFKPVREMPAGAGFADILYIPKPEFIKNYPALVIELKWNKTAQTAIQQIKDRRYPESISGYTGNILLVGISYDKNSKAHECRIEKYEKH